MSKFYVTTSIPYVNGAPHLGHALEFTIADVLARHHKRLGDDVFFSTGTDEHGGKNEAKAKEMGISPQRFVDQMSQNFKDLTQTLNIEYDGFLRTSDEMHETTAGYIWKRLDRYIYSGQYVGLYDQREEAYVTDEEAKVLKVNDPERYETLQKLEETNYFFKLSEFAPQLKKLIETNELRIVPESHKNEMLSLINSGLVDISISRPKEKLGWGVNVPTDNKQVMYVWFEALMNYITVLEYPDGRNFKTFWPCDVHVIGKDITRFHAVIWPAMLLALGLPLPKSIYVHGFVTLNGRKMSKSEGNVVAPIEIISAYGVDAFRYYFLRHIPSHGDGDFSWQKFESSYNGELGNELGNLVQRTATMINKYHRGVIGKIPEPKHDTGPYDQAMEEFRFDKALDYIWTLIKGINQYIDSEKPWKLAENPDEKEHLQEVLAYIVGSIMQTADLLSPFIPGTSLKIQQVFGSGVVKTLEGSLFPRVNNYTVLK